MHFLLNGLLIAGILHISTAINAKGCTPLDTWTFDKLISRFSAAIVKFDIAYPYGKKHDEFTKLAAAGRGADNLLVAEVGVKDYGDMENMDLQERFGVKKDDFPVVKLFVQGQEDPIDFEGEFNEDGLKKFIRQHSQVYIGLENCLEKFDRIADRFITTKDETERKQYLREAEDEWDILKNPSDRKSAETYVKLMRRMREKGNEYVREEKIRIDKLLKDKVSKEKKSELEGKINILRSFVKDEL